MNIHIDIHFTPIAPNTRTGFRIPLSNGDLLTDLYRDLGYTAKVTDFNRVIITTPYGIEEYVVSFALTGNDSQKMWERNTDENIRFWVAVENVVVTRLQNIIRYINRHHW